MAAAVEFIITVVILGYVHGAFRERLIFMRIVLPYATVERVYRDGAHLPWWRSLVRLRGWCALSIPTGMPLDLLVFVSGVLFALLAYRFAYAAVGDVIKTLAVAGLVAHLHTIAAGTGARRAGRKMFDITEKK